MHRPTPLSETIPRAAVSGAIFRGEQVLLVRRARPPALGLWSLPGGHIEPGEAAAAAVLRELMEETGVEARLGGVADVVDVINHDGSGAISFHRVIVVFYGIWTGGEPLAGSDVSAAEWRHPGEIPSLAVTPGLPDAVQRAWLRLGADRGFRHTT